MTAAGHTPLPDLTEFELQILCEIAGLRDQSPWGAAVGEALETLYGARLIESLGGGKLTDKGKTALAAAAAIVRAMKKEG
jgi:hypothetical protein